MERFRGVDLALEVGVFLLGAEFLLGLLRWWHYSHLISFAFFKCDVGKCFLSSSLLFLFFALLSDFDLSAGRCLM